MKRKTFDKIIDSILNIRSSIGKILLWIMYLNPFVSATEQNSDPMIVVFKFIIYFLLLAVPVCLTYYGMAMISPLLINKYIFGGVTLFYISIFGLYGKLRDKKKIYNFKIRDLFIFPLMRYKFKLEFPGYVASGITCELSYQNTIEWLNENSNNLWIMTYGPHYGSYFIFFTKKSDAFSFKLQFSEYIRDFDV